MEIAKILAGSFLPAWAKQKGSEAQPLLGWLRGLAGARCLNLTSGPRSSVANRPRSGTGYPQPLDQVTIYGSRSSSSSRAKETQSELARATMAAEKKSHSPWALWTTALTMEWTGGRGGGWGFRFCTQGRRGSSAGDGTSNSSRLGSSPPPCSLILLSFPL